MGGADDDDGLSFFPKQREGEGGTEGGSQRRFPCVKLGFLICFCNVVPVQRDS